MKDLLTARGSFPTGSELAEAVLAYGTALARARDIDVVDIPFIRADGTVGRVSFAIGTGIEVAITTATPLVEELFEPGTLLDILDRARAVSGARIPEAGSSDPRLGRTTTRSPRPGDDEGNWDELI